VSEAYCDVDLEGYCDDAEPCEFVNVQTVAKSRKPHTCSECREEIPVRSPYVRISYKFDGRLGCDRLCVSCRETATEFDYTLVGSGALWSTMAEQWDNGANVQGCMNRLTTVAAKALMLRKWQKWKGI
jgi:hypothetical protein